MTETVLTLDRTPDAPRLARGYVRDLDPQRIDDATLLVSELVTNAVKYGPVDGEIRLIVDRRPDAHALHGARPRRRPAARDAARWSRRRSAAAATACGSSTLSPTGGASSAAAPGSGSNSTLEVRFGVHVAPA